VPLIIALPEPVTEPVEQGLLSANPVLRAPRQTKTLSALPRAQDVQRTGGIRGCALRQLHAVTRPLHG